ncbi:hypothetical protein Chor_011411 [Crotalus horridus]
MSSSASVPGQRRTARGMDDATNKKKQKDRANQENLQLEWKQNADEVIVKLNLGSRNPKVEEVDSSFTDTSCVIKLPGQLANCCLALQWCSAVVRVPYSLTTKEESYALSLPLDGRQWSCEFYEEIESSCTKVQFKKSNILQLVLPKKIPLHNWASLSKRYKDSSREHPKRMACKENGKEKALSAGEISEEPQLDSTVELIRSKRDPSNPKRILGKNDTVGGRNPIHPGLPTGSGTKAACIKSSFSEEERNSRSMGNAGLSGEIDSQRTDRVADGAAQLDLKTEVQERESGCMEMQQPVALPPDALPSQLGPSPEKRLPQPASSFEASQGGDPAPAFREGLPSSLQPRDPETRVWSKDSDALEAVSIEPEPTVNLTFVKNDSYEKGNDSMVVHVYVKEIHREMSSVHFREQDFTLMFQTRNLIEPDQCTYNFTAARINICLKKRHSQRWGGLEAPATRGAVGGAKVAMPTGPTPLDKSQPGSNQHPLSTKEEARAGEKEKPRAEDSGLDSVAARTVSDHMPVKQEPLMPSPKPTCMVPPITHSPVSNESVEEEEEEEDKKVCLPGFTGLVNLGNTCFMNSVIQSLSNTRELRDYFHDRSFESEINYSNPLGTGGRLAIGFAVLLRALWKGTHHAFQPSKLKAIVASKASQFTGYAQHDAQEFMAFLLDGLHEDLNRIQNKPYTETVDSDGRPDEVVAEEAWQRHKMRNDSFIVDLFQGQFKSKLVCPVCSKVSITFDPFLYLPVPLPQKQKVLTVYYFAKEPHNKPIKFLVSISKENSTAMEVLDSVIKNRFHRMFLPSQSLDAVSPTDLLLCFEVLSPELAKERVVELQVQQVSGLSRTIPITKCAACQKKQQSEEEKLKRCTRCYRVGYCNVVCQRTHWSSHKTLCRPENIGFPFLVSIPESRLTYARLVQLLEGYARYSVSVFQPPFQVGRVPSEQGLPLLSSEKQDPPVRNSCATVGSAAVTTAVETSALEAGEGARAPHFLQEPQPSLSAPELQPELGDASTARTKVPTGRNSDLSLDSGYSEPSAESQLESCMERELPYERVPRPEAAILGYQHPAEGLSSQVTQFYINKIDATSKEQKLEDKGDAPLDLTSDCSLALVWKNNERMKEFVLIKSKELECVEDPSSASEAARAGHFTLEQCLNLFTKPEVLAPEEAWYCPKCKQHREASKQLMLWRLPNILIIQLKRFSFRSFIWRDKINDMVDFPVRSLDLSKFCIGQKDEQQLPMYDLYAVINHYGGIIGGHYTAYARLPSDKNSQRSDVGWRLFDDSTVTTVDESQVVTRYAYVLFYRRRNSPVDRPPRGPPHPSDARADLAPSAEATASQASLLWQELEAEEDAARRLMRNPWRSCSQRTRKLSPECPDEGHVRYFVLGTMAAIVALFLNVFYPLIYQTRWR